MKLRGAKRAEDSPGSLSHGKNEKVVECFGRGRETGAMETHYRPYEPEQPFLLPPALRDWLPKLFVKVVQLARKMGLVKLGTVALDGTKIKANASKHKAMSCQRMKEEEQRLEKEIQQLLEEAQQTDRRSPRARPKSQGLRLL